MLTPNLTADPATWTGSSLVSVKQLTPEGLHRLLVLALDMRTIYKYKSSGEFDQAHVTASQSYKTCATGKILSNVFYEASTRTSCSFQAAILRLGGTVINVNATSSSAKKGETLSDTIRCLECYADVTVLRHPETGSVPMVAATSLKPVLNAGDGTNEHPTQALLDIFTMVDCVANFNNVPPSQWSVNVLDGKTIAMVGDLKNGRTVHSLSRLLSTCGAKNVTLKYVSPEVLRMPGYVMEDVGGGGGVVEQIEETDLNSVVSGGCDVIYVTRIQKERFASEDEYNEVNGCYIIGNDTMALDKSGKCVLLHPLPRVGEIKEEVDTDERAKYFEQMENGMYVRMALLASVLGVVPK